MNTRDIPHAHARWLNLVLYQVGWFGCVLGAARDHPWAGMSVALALTAVHLALLPKPAGEIKLLLLAGLLGAVADSLQTSAGLLEFRSGSVVAWLAPPWIVVMWLQFATLLRFSTSFLLRRYLLSAVLAAIGGPLAYWTGSRLGAVSLRSPLTSLAVLSVIWAVAFPTIVWFAGRQIEPETINRYRLRSFGAPWETRP